MSARVSSLVLKTKDWGLDSIRLAQSLYQSWRVHPKPLTLLLKDHLDNPIAVQLLSAHKEYNLLRYYGVRGYVKQRKNKAAGSQGESPYSNAETPGPSSPSVARISFMVTARMKEELINNLGYSPEFIAKLKPLEASLILQHQVRDASTEAIAQLVQSHDEQREREMELLRERLESEQQDPTPLQALDTTTKGAPPTAQELDSKDANSHPNAPPKVPILSNFASQSKLYGSSASASSGSSSSPTSSQPRTWFELVERSPQGGEQSVLGLYATPEEAEEGLETHRFFARRNRRDVDFEIRQSIR
jgi:hypothetical protein